MLMMKASQRLFFDSAAVMKSMSKAERQVNSKIGAFIMTTARGSMVTDKKGGKPSKPGQPPKARKGSIKKGRYGVLFSWDPETRSVVIGPTIFPGVKQRCSGTNIETLEKGGTIRVQEGQRKDGTWSRRAAAWAKINGLQERETTGRLEARPYMQPALEKNLPKLSSMWVNALHKV